MLPTDGLVVPHAVTTHPTAHDRVAWCNPDLVGRPVMSERRLGRGYVGALMSSPLSTHGRARRLAQIARWAVVRGPHPFRDVAPAGLDVVGGRTPVRHDA